MPARLKPCGTRAAYRRHQIAGETPCDPCKAAHAEWSRNHEDTRIGKHPCPGCGKSIRSRGLCRACREHLELGLYDGDWVVRNGIQVWVPWAEDGAA